MKQYKQTVGPYRKVQKLLEINLKQFHKKCFFLSYYIIVDYFNSKNFLKSKSYLYGPKQFVLHMEELKKEQNKIKSFWIILTVFENKRCN